jgi:hypothetical protein
MRPSTCRGLDHAVPNCTAPVARVRPNLLVSRLRQSVSAIGGSCAGITGRTPSGARLGTKFTTIRLAPAETCYLFSAIRMPNRLSMIHSESVEVVSRTNCCSSAIRRPTDDSLKRPGEERTDRTAYRTMRLYSCLARTQRGATDNWRCFHTESCTYGRPAAYWSSRRCSSACQRQTPVEN